MTLNMVVATSANLTEPVIVNIKTHDTSALTRA